MLMLMRTPQLITMPGWACALCFLLLAQWEPPEHVHKFINAITDCCCCCSRPPDDLP